MRAATHLKPVRNDGNEVRVESDRKPEARETWLETSRLPNLIDDMERMMTEMFNRPLTRLGMMPLRGLFHEIGRTGVMTPTLDVFEDNGMIIVKSDLPGLTKEDIKIRLVDNILEITGEKKTEENVDRRDYLRLERSYGTFNRTVRLPEGLDAENVTAAFTNGVLEIRIPKVEEKRAVKHIDIS